MYTDRNKYCTFIQAVRLLEKSLIFTRKAKWTMTCVWLFLHNFPSKQFLLRQATGKLHCHRYCSVFSIDAEVWGANPGRHVGGTTNILMGGTSYLWVLKSNFHAEDLR
jgi:hypothetical protein